MPTFSLVAAARRRLPVRSWWFPVAVFVVLSAACGGSSDSGGPSSGSARAITISNFEFAPETLEVRVGDRVTVENKDSAEHTVTAADKSFDTGRFASGTRTFTVTKPGRFEYICEVHPFMTHRFIQVAG